MPLLHSSTRTVLLTGSGSSVGSRLLEHYLTVAGPSLRVVATDQRLLGASIRKDALFYEVVHLEHQDLDEVLRRYHVEVVVHLAPSLPPGVDASVSKGTQRLLAAAVRHGVSRFVNLGHVSAYGYHWPDGGPVDEDASLTAHPALPGSGDRVEVERLVAETATQQPGMSIVSIRPATILRGESQDAVVRLLDSPWFVGPAGWDPHYGFVSDVDVAAAVRAAVDAPPEFRGAFNVAGDGDVRFSELEATFGRRMVRVGDAALPMAIGVAHALGRVAYRAAEVDVMFRRPVLDTRRIREALGWRPASSAPEVLQRFAASRRA